MGKRSKKRVLGRGLSVLLGDVEKNTFNEKAQNIDQEVVGKIIELEINEIEINPSQPRSNFSETLIKEEWLINYSNVFWLLKLMILRRHDKIVFTKLKFEMCVLK